MRIPVSPSAFFHNFLLELVLIKIVTLDLFLVRLIHRSIVVTWNLSWGYGTFKLLLGKVILRLLWLEEGYFSWGFRDWVIGDRVLLFYHLNLWLYVLLSVYIIAYYLLLVICSDSLSLLYPCLILLTTVLINVFLWNLLLIPHKLISSIFSPYFTPQIGIRRPWLLVATVQVSTVRPFIHTPGSWRWKLLTWYLM